MRKLSLKKILICFVLISTSLIFMNFNYVNAKYEDDELVALDSVMSQWFESKIKSGVVAYKDKQYEYQVGDKNILINLGKFPDNIHFSTENPTVSVISGSGIEFRKKDDWTYGQVKYNGYIYINGNKYSINFNKDENENITANIGVTSEDAIIFGKGDKIKYEFYNKDVLLASGEIQFNASSSSTQEFDESTKNDDFSLNSEIEKQTEKEVVEATAEKESENSFFEEMLAGIWHGLVDAVVNIANWAFGATGTEVDTTTDTTTGDPATTVTATEELKGTGFPTVEGIIFNKVPMTTINFFTAAKDDDKTPVGVMKGGIATWYKIFRNIAIGFYFVMLIFTGFKIALTSIASEQSKYKDLIKNWAIGLMMLFIFQFAMNGIIVLNNKVIQILDPTEDTEVSQKIDTTTSSTVEVAETTLSSEDNKNNKGLMQAFHDIGHDTTKKTSFIYTTLFARTCSFKYYVYIHIFKKNIIFSIFNSNISASMHIICI